MLYESIQPWKVYPGQNSISLPKNADGTQIGRGNAVFLLAPNKEASSDILSNPGIRFRVSGYKAFTADDRYAEKIGTKKINLMRRTELRNFYTSQKIPLRFLNESERKTYTATKQNIIVDLSQWLQLHFRYAKKTSARLICELFAAFMAKRLGDPIYNDYKKTILINIDQWVSDGKNCFVMNKKLLTNPISILLYTIRYFPQLLYPYQNMDIFIISTSERKIIRIPMDDIDPKKYTLIKSRLSQFDSIVVSGNETDSDISEAELKVELQNEHKSRVFKELRYGLLGDSPAISSDDDEGIIDITKEIDDMDDSDDEIDDEDEVASDDDEDSPTDEVLSETEDILREEVEGFFEENPDAGVVEANDEITKRVTKRYISKFVPERTPEELAKIERLRRGQDEVIKPLNIHAIESKIIATEDMSSYIKTTNPHIQRSRFKNFDGAYVDKKLEADMDAAVGALSNAEHPIFITGKESIDSSSAMDLKRTMIYHLEDLKGNKMTVKFDVPVIIDDKYIFVNGAKKIIGHQFVLKPLVKTGPNVVQLVSWYNKVFIYRTGQEDSNTNMIRVYLQKNPDTFEAKPGSAIMKNSKYETPLDFDSFSKIFYQFTINGHLFITEIDALMKRYHSMKKPNEKMRSPNFAKEVPVSINLKTGALETLPLGESFVSHLLSIFTEEQKAEIEKIKRKPKLITAEAKMMSTLFPLILFLCYIEGFTETARRVRLDYRFIPNEEKRELKEYSRLEYSAIPLQDSILVWRKTDPVASILMNGLVKEPLTEFTREDLDNKDTWRYLMGRKARQKNIDIALDNYKDFLMDPASKEILEDHGLPTNLPDLLIFAAGLLTDNKYKTENNMENMRVRSAEVIPNIVHMKLTEAYTKYRKTAYKKKPTKISINPNAIINTLLDGDTVNLVSDYSSLNPILELEKGRAVTFKGLRGIQMDRAMTLARRGYDESMLGNIAISTSSDANVGVVRELTLEPNITSTRGYLGAGSKKKVDSLNSANLFGCTELLTPLGVQHDDPDRTSMSYKQTKYMVPVEAGSPVLIGNKVEAIIPYHLSDEFVVDAKEDGTVVDRTKEYVVVRYKSGKNYAIDITNRVKKNSSGGFYIENDLKCDLEVGQKFKKGDVLAYNDLAFSRNADDRGVSMKLGVLTKVAILSNWDEFEDSAPITAKLANQMATTMIAEKSVVLTPNTVIDHICKIGDKVKTGDPLIRFAKEEDDEVQKFLDGLRDELRLEIIEDTKSTVKSKYTGEVADIRIYSTVPTEDMCPSLKKVVEDYHRRIKRKTDVLEKYKNEGDLNFYKAGQIIDQTTEVMQPNATGKLQGEYVQDSIIIKIYVKYRDIAAKGDKICAEFALKGVVSHVIPEGEEPYSEYRPDEEISTMVAPLAVAARKVPSVFLAMFGNKCLIELKRQLSDMYLKKSGGIPERRKQFMAHLTKCMDLLDPSKQNSANYKEKFTGMSDAQFDKWCKTFFGDPDANWYLEIVEYDRDLTIENIEACANHMKVPLFERVALPYVTHDPDNVQVTPEPVPVGYIHEKRMPQTLMKKSSGSISIAKVNPKTGQVSGEDKNARNTDTETYTLIALGAVKGLIELMGPRADDHTAKRQMYSAINRKGFVSLDELDNDPKNKVALNTFDVYFAYQGLLTNLITPLNRVSTYDKNK